MGVFQKAIDYYKRHKTERYLMLLVFLLCIALIVGVATKISIILTITVVLLGLLFVVSLYFSIKSYNYFNKVLQNIRREHLAEIIKAGNNADVVLTPSFSEEETKYIKRQKRGRFMMIIMQIVLIVGILIALALGII